MKPPATFLLAAGVILISVKPVAAQGPSRSSASILRAAPDARLSVAMEPTLSLGGEARPAVLPAPGDSVYANYGLEGALIGGLTTGLALTFLICASLEDADCGPPALFLGTAVFGLPGFVIGGLIGAGIKKDKGEADSRPASLTDPALDSGRAGDSPILPVPRLGF